MTTPINYQGIVSAFIEVDRLLDRRAAQAEREAKLARLLLQQRCEAFGHIFSEHIAAPDWACRASGQLCAVCFCPQSHSGVFLIDCVRAAEEAVRTDLEDRPQ